MSLSSGPVEWTEVSDRARLVNQPLVTVSMLTCNQEPYLTAAIESVLAQPTKYPFELIIAEDASTDATREIALAYQRRYQQWLFASRHGLFGYSTWTARTATAIATVAPPRDRIPGRRREPRMTARAALKADL
jgi:glycosyltransferase involved in cell wall biosynthesis